MIIVIIVMIVVVRQIAIVGLPIAALGAAIMLNIFGMVKVLVVVSVGIIMPTTMAIVIATTTCLKPYAATTFPNAIVGKTDRHSRNNATLLRAMRVFA